MCKQTKIHHPVSMSQRAIVFIAGLVMFILQVNNVLLFLLCMFIFVLCQALVFLRRKELDPLYKVTLWFLGVHTHLRTLFLLLFLL